MELMLVAVGRKGALDTNEIEIEIVCACVCVCVCVCVRLFVRLWVFV